jgi:hypothetical protein
MASIMLTSPARIPNPVDPGNRDLFLGVEDRNRRAQAEMVKRNMYSGRLVRRVLAVLLALCICVIFAGFAMGPRKEAAMSYRALGTRSRHSI